MSLINQMLQDLDRRNASMVGSIPLENVRVSERERLGGSATENAEPFTPVKKPNIKLAIGLIGLSLFTVAGWYATTQMHLPLLKIMQQHPNALQTDVISSAHANVPEIQKSNNRTTQKAAIAAQHNTQEHVQTANINQQLALLTKAEITNSALLQAKIEEINQLKSQLQQMAQDATHRQFTAHTPAVKTKPVPTPSVDSVTKAADPSVAETTASRTLEKATVEATIESPKPLAIKPAFNKQVSPEQEAENNYNQALAMLQLGRASEAQVLLSKALTVNPNNYDIRQTLVGVLVDLKRNNEAIDFLKAGLQLAPQQLGFTQMLARLLVENNQRGEALAVLTKASPYAHGDAQYHAFLAALLQSEEQHKDAIDHYMIALKHGNQANWLVGLGISLQAEGRMQEAREIYTKAQSTTLNADLAQFVDQRLKQVQQQIN